MSWDSLCVLCSIGDGQGVSPQVIHLPGEHSFSQDTPVIRGRERDVGGWREGETETDRREGERERERGREEVVD